MLLALDIGNSNIVMGVSDQGEWVHQWRIQTDAGKTADEYGILFKSLFSEAALSYNQFTRVIVCNVVPRLTQTINEVFRRRSSVQPIIVNDQIETGIKIKRQNPDRVGSDLIAGAAGAYAVFGDDCMVVDFGTATTIMVVKNPGELIGGAVCAGLNVTIDALVAKAAQLSQIPLELPANPVGESPIEAMQSGLVLGHLCMIEGLIDRMKTQLGSDTVNVIA